LRFHYCPKCGGQLENRWENHTPRLTCISCSYRFYENPVVGVAGILLNQRGQILLGRRCRGDYVGCWCIPCGYVEYHEDVYEAVRREFKEESNLDVEVLEPFSVQSNFHNPGQHSVGIWFMVRITSGYMLAGDDLDQLAYFDLDNLPPLAFPTDRNVLNLLRQSRKN